MSIDPIVDELHRMRAEEMERLNFDFEAFFQSIKEEERLSSRPLLSPPKPISPDAKPLRGRLPRR
jgi:hypothetical protein